MALLLLTTRRTPAPVWARDSGISSRKRIRITALRLLTGTTKVQRHDGDELMGQNCRRSKFPFADRAGCHALNACPHRVRVVGIEEPRAVVSDPELARPRGAVVDLGPESRRAVHLSLPPPAGADARRFSVRPRLLLASP